MPFAFYNDTDEYCCTWLENLISARIIPYGVVDPTPIQKLKPATLAKFTQVHLFAGMGGWAYALRLAGWPDAKPVWTGSCPCQPFSVAGKRKAQKDSRHLWPFMYRLIRASNPPVCFGEQVASTDGRLWLSRVRSDLEAGGYATGLANLCAAGISAPHLRNRYFFVADSNPAWRGSNSSKRHINNGHIAERQEANGGNTHPVESSTLANCNGYHRHWWSGPVQVGWNAIQGEVERGGRRYHAQWRIEPGVRIVANGVPCRVGQLRAAGNAIVPQLAAEFISAYCDLLL
jgi:DNA (cytosine-5)-methyltransferase 1